MQQILLQLWHVVNKSINYFIVERILRQIDLSGSDCVTCQHNAFVQLELVD